MPKRTDANRELDNYHKRESCILKRYEFNAAPDGMDGSHDTVSVRFSYGKTVADIDAHRLKTLRLAMPRDAAKELAITLLALLAKTWREDEADESKTPD